MHNSRGRRVVKIAGIAFALALSLATEAARVPAPPSPLAQVVAFQPADTGNIQFVKAGTAAPLATDCYAQGIRCFNPTAMENAYNVTPLYGQGYDGRGQTIVIVHALGSAYLRNDL